MAMKLKQGVTVNPDGANNQEKKVTLSVNSVSSTGFVIRLVTAGGDGASSRARAAISWEAFK